MTAAKTAVLLLALAALAGLGVLLWPPPNPIPALLPKLQNQKNPVEIAKLLQNLRQQLSALPKDRAVRFTSEFLNGKMDAALGAEFTVGADGFLKVSPTLRVFLLDYLAQLDPPTAKEHAQQILAQLNSPDEWAIGLRSYAQADTSTTGKQWLTEKMAQMLRHDPWVDHPSTGFLEAFDVAVYLAATNLVPELSRLIRKQDNQAVAHASFLALDRLVIAAPDPILALLQADPGLMQGREITRANLFARADVQDPRQRQILETYLLDSNLGAEELAKFAGLYPNANYMVSDNLLTRVATPASATLARRDAAALQVVNAWLADPRFASRTAQLTQIQKRLAEFVRQGNQP